MLTLSEIKQSLKIKSNEFDSLIENLITPCTQEVISYTNNFFVSPSLVFEERITFEEGVGVQTKIKLTSELTSFPASGWVAIRLGSLNNGVYKYEKAQDGLSLLVPNYMVIGSDNCLLSYCEFPQDVKMNFPMLIAYYLYKKGVFEKSESLPGGYSVSYKNKQELLNNLFGLYRVL